MTNEAPKPTIDADRYPLYWPEGWPRSQRRERTTRYKVTFSHARDELVAELKRMGGSDVVLSTNIPLRKDGLPRMDVSEPADPGVAVYWLERVHTGDAVQHKSRVIACDRWATTRDNMRAVGLAVSALRALQRSGATQVIDRVFGGFTALPANVDESRPRFAWRTILGFAPGAVVTPTQLREAYLGLVAKVHPDKPGGSDSALRAVNAAHAAARAELGVSLV